MTIRLFCDICGKEIPEASEGEGWDCGDIQLCYGLWQEGKTEIVHDTVCLKCYNTIKESVYLAISNLTKEGKKK